MVNNASVLGWRAQRGQAHYAAAKAGVMAFTRCAALEAAEFGVRINAVAPSIAMHPFLAKVTTDELLAKLSAQEALWAPCRSVGSGECDDLPRVRSVELHDRGDCFGVEPARMTQIYPTPTALIGAEGTALGPTDWLQIDQTRVNGFAEVTGDHQWIHVDEERAKDGPFGGTIAHGYLTMSLVNSFCRSSSRCRALLMR
jgi:NAD(P)-dependent dehydrogenase (short-subunit alcohol dehydrogenase family)